MRTNSLQLALFPAVTLFLILILIGIDWYPAIVFASFSFFVSLLGDDLIANIYSKRDDD